MEKEAFNTIFMLSPRIMAGSLISYFLGELINATIISNLKLKFKGQLFAIRAIFSTFVSSFIESILFGIIAFYGRMSDDELIKMIVKGFACKKVLNVFNKIKNEKQIYCDLSQ